MNEIVSFGEWLRRRRQALDLTRPVLAARVGCATITIKKIEHDERRPSRQIAGLLADQLQVPKAIRERFIEMARGRYVGPMPSPLTGTQVESPEPPRWATHPKSAASPLPFLDEDIEQLESVENVFIGRERQLSLMHAYLNKTLSGQGQIIFVTGDAGRGKTSLLNEFIRQAQRTHHDLIVSRGNCTAYAGVGDPYLPFRDVMELLAGGVLNKWSAGAITKSHAQRLWNLMPNTAQALEELGLDLIDVFVSGATLIERVNMIVPRGTPWLERLKEWAGQARRSATRLERTSLFEQYVNVLNRLAAQHPILITLDDLQWADAGSIGLLFHLGRRIVGKRILIVGAYRPEEVAAAFDGHRHPLEKVLSEFKRSYGDVWIDLHQVEEDEERRFVDNLLDSEPNLLDEGFRSALMAQTGGHPLFTIELLRAMQARGHLEQDEARRWVEGPTLDWSLLPARVEGVIEERIGRLEPNLRETLTVASVEGEWFTAEVVAAVRGQSRRRILNHLSQDLEKRHRLVREREPIQIGRRVLSCYHFTHILIQRHLYTSLSIGERRLLHGEIAEALEALYGNQTEEISSQLAHHFLEAGHSAKATEYLYQAGKRAKKLYAYDEAVRHLGKALESLELEESPQTRLVLLEELGDVYGQLRRDPQAIPTYASALELWATLSGADQMIAVRLHRKILELAYAMKDFVEFARLDAHSQTVAQSRAFLEENWSGAQKSSTDLEWVLVLTALATDALANATDERLQVILESAEEYALAAVAMAEELGAEVELSDALQALAGVYFAAEELPKQLTISRRRLELSRNPRFGDVRNQINILIDLSNVLIQAGKYGRALEHLSEAETLAAQMRLEDREVWSLALQAECFYRLDRWDELLEIDERRAAAEKLYSRDAIGGSCLELAFAAAIHALRGDLDQATALRELSYRRMVATAGPADTWGRGQYY